MNASIYSQLTPEQLQQVLSLGTFDDEGSLLEQQMAQAQALRNPMGGQRSTALGAGIAALGDTLRGITGAIQEGRIRKEQEALIPKRKAGRSIYADLLRQQGRYPQLLQPPPEFTDL